MNDPGAEPQGILFIKTKLSVRKRFSYYEKFQVRETSNTSQESLRLCDFAFKHKKKIRLLSVHLSAVSVFITLETPQNIWQVQKCLVFLRYERVLTKDIAALIHNWQIQQFFRNREKLLECKNRPCSLAFVR